jgi:two-component system KDP operon response regulator KdpE
MATRILIVDDEPNILATVAPLLSARGYEVFSAMSGRAALEAVDRDKPDLIVLDLGLPDVDGVEVCRRVRASLSVPILVLSARGAEGDKVGALDAGADDYVTKPFGAEELLARIRATLRRVESPSPPSEPIVRGGLVIFSGSRGVDPPPRLPNSSAARCTSSWPTSSCSSRSAAGSSSSR